MPNEKNKASLLSAQLDFEGVASPPAKSEALDFFDLDIDANARTDMLEEYLPSPLLPDSPVAEPQSSANTVRTPSTVVKEPVVPELLKPQKSVSRSNSSNKSSKKKKEGKSDNFALYAAIVALCGFLAVFVAIFYVKVIADDGETPTYLTLPETVVNVDNNVVRIKITLQVEKKDRGWLNTNKVTLMQLLPIVMTKIDPNDLHSEEGFDLVREKLRVELNREMKTDKIQSVLLDQLLMKSRD
ncbi:flagellar basal body-associated FliL family protein [Undibacterium jejuense]|uniref:Flagellar protein FliL n=1 Tax=Undibacterium jejuense TaxID=1344949 RepID=A0A923HHB6_9BURK|nr:flagellar basal body-associated FliL family protein [Undibacterium jejuense]MBC3864046.1 flagellar basal body-associated FliL family protein [Undibacterium jejuense]